MSSKRSRHPVQRRCICIVAVSTSFETKLSRNTKTRYFHIIKRDSDMSRRLFQMDVAHFKADLTNLTRDRHVGK